MSLTGYFSFFPIFVSSLPANNQGKLFYSLKMNRFEDILKGGDLRSLGQSSLAVSLIHTQQDFDELFGNLFHTDRRIVMRTSDVVEKISFLHPEYLNKHKAKLFKLCQSATAIELKWHLALIIPRIKLTQKELGMVWQNLTHWAIDKKESKIVRVNSIQGLYLLLQNNKELDQDFSLTLSEIERKNIPSLNARIRKLRKHHGK